MRWCLRLLLAASPCLAMLMLLPLESAAQEPPQPPRNSASQARMSASSEAYPGRGRLDRYPPTDPFREPYFFPKTPPQKPRWDRLREVTIHDNYYSPSLLWVQSGTTVRFKNAGRDEHTTTCPWLWESGELKPGKTFSVTFTRKGVYQYFDRMEGKSVSGRIEVH